MLRKEHNGKIYSRFIRKIRGGKVSFFDEGSGNHPADYEYHSYITQEQLRGLQESLQIKIKQSARANRDGYVASLSVFTERKNDESNGKTCEKSE